MITALSPTLYFLSDYGLADEFVGVVHAVVAREAPGVDRVDLTHCIAPFDVVAGARALERAAPFLGPGVVLAVVDPGVGGPRRAVALEVSGAGPRHWVGPDNGLLWPAVGEQVVAAVHLEGRRGPAVTFDGRDLFAPACAALARGAALETLGSPLDPAQLVRLEPARCEVLEERGRAVLRAEVTWVDRFGNVQLAARAASVPGPLGTLLRAGRPAALSLSGRSPLEVPVVSSFSALPPRGPGLLVDANGHLALALREGSAAARLALRAGDLVEVTWASS